ncbi:hypothetical protein D9758_004369 [Tetrapyrgos nigripes]|uniref:Uncharacterized protein n=1 Tax=Tetrapyrgos nigripes TaxID=182062 RepID=A0A8H5GMM8_9AGAR|nr:hypothetical protein D9758_004369 [Tetrapyrgos nigripes]
MQLEEDWLAPCSAMTTSLLQMNVLPDPSHFVDNLCTQLFLTDTQNMDLQAAVQLGHRLDRGSLLLQLVTQANIFRLQNTVDKLLTQDTSTVTVLQDFKNQVTDNWIPNEDDKAKVAKAIREALTDPHRTSFAKAGDDIFNKLELGKNTLKLCHAFKSPKRRESFRKYVRKTTNNYKGTLRSQLFETTLGKKKKGLHSAVIKLEATLKVTHNEAQRVKFTCRVALWRRYIRDIIANSTPTQTKRLRGDTEESSAAPEASSDTEESSSKLDSFWSGFDSWLAGLSKKMGSNIESAAWRRYLDETAKLDEKESSASIAAPALLASTSIFRAVTLPTTNTHPQPDNATTSFFEEQDKRMDTAGDIEELQVYEARMVAGNRTRHPLYSPTLSSHNSPHPGSSLSFGTRFHQPAARWNSGSVSSSRGHTSSPMYPFNDESFLSSPGPETSGAPPITSFLFSPSPNDSSIRNRPYGSGTREHHRSISGVSSSLSPPLSSPLSSSFSSSVSSSHAEGWSNGSTAASGAHSAGPRRPWE